MHLYPMSEREISGCAFDSPFFPDEVYIEERRKELRKVGGDIWQSIFCGGYPEVCIGDVSPSDYYESYLKTYIERDIRQLTQVGDEMQFLSFIRAAAARTGNLVNYSDLARDVGISEATAKKWLSLLVTSGLVYLLQPYSANVEKRVIKTPKLYFIDTGLAAHLTRWSGPEVIQSGAMAGNFFETWVIGEIVKSFANNGMDAPLYFYRDKDKKEIDLIICRDQNIFPVEIKKTATPGRDDARNFDVLNRIKNVTIEKSLIICNCQSPVSVSKGCIAIPVGYI